MFGYAPEYVIVTSASLAPEFARLAHWKNRLGTPTLVESIEDIRASYPAGVDDAERVRLFLRDAHQTWNTRWVLIGGDASVIPVRLAYSTFYGGLEIPTDLYYACLDGSWNADGDARWGEGYQTSADPGDDADLSPELYVGRAPVRTPEEARHFVDKTLRWSFLPVEPRAHQVLVAADVLFPSNWVPGYPPDIDGGEMAEVFLPSILDNPDVQITRLYENYAQWPDSRPLDRQSLLESLNLGYDLLLHCGGGSDTQLSAGPDVVSVPDVLALTNATRLTNVYSMGSTTVSFDHLAIGNAFLAAPDGGGVTYMGPTQFAFVTSARAVATEFVRLVYDADVSAIGEAFARQMQPILPYTQYDGVSRLTVMEWALLGDPGLTLYQRPGAPLLVEHAPQIGVGASGIAVMVSSAGAPLEGARVAASVAGENLALATTGADGAAHVPFAAAGPGKIDLTVTAPDGRRWAGSLVATEALAVGDPRPGTFRMLPPAPVPARTTLRVSFELPAGTPASDVRLAVFDATGRRVRELTAVEDGTGRGRAIWDLRSAAGGRVPDGVYFLSARTRDAADARRVLVLQ